MSVQYLTPAQYAAELRAIHAQYLQAQIAAGRKQAQPQVAGIQRLAQFNR